MLQILLSLVLIFGLCACDSCPETAACFREQNCCY